MIIVDQTADAKLAITLEKLKAQPDNSRCIYFDLKTSDGISSEVKETVIASVRKHIPSPDIQIYLCDDGDIFILASVIPSKEGKLCILDIADYVGRKASDDWVGFYEFPLHIHLPLAAVEQKIEARRQAQKNARKQQEQQQAERKRNAILNIHSISKNEDIEERRTNRSFPELMIIEDDGFSRRLVENALQKQYALTGLGEADMALATYARIAPDMLFLDINLPDVTGLELLERIIAIDPDAYVIMLSGNADRENIMQAMNKGAKGFVAKPFTRDKLFQYINRCPAISLKQQRILA